MTAPAVKWTVIGTDLSNPVAVYRCYDETGTLLYVGCSKDPVRRNREHTKSSPWVTETVRIDVCWYPSAAAASAAERAAIRTEEPAFNSPLAVLYRAEPGPTGGGLTKRALWFDDDTWQEAADVAARLGLSHSEVIRRAIRAGLPHVEQDTRP